MVDGRTLHFHLQGINNQNFIMRDEETGSWWQQVSGEAIQGPLKGKRLEPVPWDEVSFAIWKQEHPNSLVLLPDQANQDQYLPADWDARITGFPSVAGGDAEGPLQPRDLVVGISASEASKAYPMDSLVAQSPVNDKVGETAILLVVGADGKSVRCFDRTIDGQTLELFRKADSETLVLLDAQTGSEWDFSGKAIAGPLAGRQLTTIQPLKDFWFDWKNYHPDTAIYLAGRLPAAPSS